MMHGDGGWHGSFGMGHWGFGILFWLLVLLVVVALVKYLIDNGGKRKE